MSKEKMLAVVLTWLKANWLKAVVLVVALGFAASGISFRSAWFTCEKTKPKLSPMDKAAQERRIK